MRTVAAGDSDSMDLPPCLTNVTSQRDAYGKGRKHGHGEKYHRPATKIIGSRGKQHGSDRWTPSTPRSLLLVETSPSPMRYKVCPTLASSTETLNSAWRERSPIDQGTFCHLPQTRCIAGDGKGASHHRKCRLKTCQRRSFFATHYDIYEPPIGSGPGFWIADILVSKFHNVRTAICSFACILGNAVCIFHPLRGKDRSKVKLHRGAISVH